MIPFVKDFTTFNFKALKLGDTIHTRGILIGISDEPLVWKLTEFNLSKTDLIFDVTYFGASIGGFGIRNGKVMEL